MTEGSIEVTASAAYRIGAQMRERVTNLMRAAISRINTSALSARQLSIEERITIGPKKTLILINCAGRRFLIATAADAITPIVEVHPLNETWSRCGASEAPRWMENL